MTIPKLTYIKDFYNISEEESTGKEYVIINSINDIIKARRIIELWKNNDIDSCVIINKAEQTDYLFSDLQYFGNVVIIKDINPKDTLSKRLNINIELNLSNDDIIQLEILSNMDRFEKLFGEIIKQNISLKDAFWKTVFTFSTGIEAFAYLGIDMKKSYILLFQQLDEIKANKLYHMVNIPIFKIKFFDFLIDIVSNDFDKKFWQYIKTSIDNKCLYQWVSEIKINYLLSNYKRVVLISIRDKINDKFTIPRNIRIRDNFSPDLLLSKEDIKIYLGECIDNTFEYIDLDLYYELNNAVSQVLDNYVKDINDVNGYNLYFLIKSMSGYLLSEIKYIISLIYLDIEHRGMEDLGYVLGIMKYVFKNLEKIQDRLEINIEKELNNIHLVYYLTYEIGNRDISGFTKEEWFNYYIESIIPTQEIIYKLEDDVKFSIIEESVIQKAINFAKTTLNEIDYRYQDWILVNYCKLLKERNHFKLNFVTDVVNVVSQNLLSDKKVVFFVIDALRWDLWRSLEQVLFENCYLNSIGNTAVFSMLPSTTEISRKSLFGGLTFDDLIKQQIQKGIYLYNEADTMAKAIGYEKVKEEQKEVTYRSKSDTSKMFKYVLGGIEEFNKALAENPECLALVVPDLDGIWHKVKVQDKTINKIGRTIFKDLISDMVNNIIDDDTVIIVATDHGAINCTHAHNIQLPDTVKFLEDKGIVYIDKHSRFVVICGDPNNKFAQNVYDLKDNNWYLIPREKLNDFGLSETLKVPGKPIQQVLAYLIPKKHNYYNAIKSGYTHGGLSMYETIVPVSIFKKGNIDFSDISLKLNAEIIDKKFNIRITNQSSVNVEKIFIYIEHEKLNYQVFIPYIKSNDIIELKEKTNSYLEDFNLEKVNYRYRFEILGETIEKRDVGNIVTSQPKRSRLSRKLEF